MYQKIEKRLYLKKSYAILLSTKVVESGKERDMAYKNDNLKKLHIQKIKDCFYRESIWDKNCLSEETGISKTTCTTILKELEEAEFIFQVQDGESTGGRPRKRYQLNKDNSHSCLILFTVGKYRKIEIQLRDLYGQVLYREVCKFSKFSMKDLSEMLNKVFERDKKIAVIALSIPGVVDEREKIVSCDIKELEHQNIKLLLETLYQVDVVIENDVNLAVVGYHKGEESVAFLYQPSVMYSGCGIMLQGQLYRGSTLFAGELGYLKHCAGKEPKTKKDAIDVILEQVSALICVLNPERICICSSFSILQEEICLELAQWILPEHIPEIEVIDEMEPFIFQGLMEATIDVQREHVTIKEVRKV